MLKVLYKTIPALVTTLLCSCGSSGPTFGIKEEEKPNALIKPSFEYSANSASSIQSFNAERKATEKKLRTECHVYDDVGHGFIFKSESLVLRDEKQNLLSHRFDAQISGMGKQKEFHSTFTYSPTDFLGELVTPTERKQFSVEMPFNLGVFQYAGQASYLEQNGLAQYDAPNAPMTFGVGSQEGDVVFRLNFLSAGMQTVSVFGLIEGAYHLKAQRVYNYAESESGGHRYYACAVTDETFGYEAQSLPQLVPQEDPIPTIAEAGVSILLGTGEFYGASAFAFGDLFGEEDLLPKDGSIAPSSPCKFNDSPMGIDASVAGGIVARRDDKQGTSFWPIWHYLASLNGK